MDGSADEVTDAIMRYWNCKMLRSLAVVLKALTRLKSVILLGRFNLVEQYRFTALGLGWSVISPALTITILSFAFSIILRLEVKDYPLYLMSGLLPWILFTNNILQISNAVINRAHIFSKTQTRISLFIFSDALANFYLFILAFGAMHLTLTVFFTGMSSDNFFSSNYAIPLLITSASIGFFLATLVPKYRDIKHITEVLLNAVYWTVPIIYTIDHIPTHLIRFFDYHPVFILIWPLQCSTYYGTLPSLNDLISASLVALASIVIAVLSFKFKTKTMVFYL